MARRRAFNAGGELISKTLSSLVNGVSQQPVTLRQASQGEAQENLLSLAADGARRRPPAEHIDILTTDALPTRGYKTHLRARDETLQHLVLIEDGDIRVFRLSDGVEATVNGLPVGGYVSELTGAETDQTTEANEATAGDMDLIPALTVTSGSYFGFAHPFKELEITVSTAGVGTYTVLWQYSTGSDAWSSLAGVTDNTTGFTVAGKNTVTFTVPTDWVTDEVGTVTGLYWVRALYVSGTMTTLPLGTQAWISAKPYLDLAATTEARDGFAITSVADYSFVVNKETTVAMSGTAEADRPNAFMINWVEPGSSAGQEWQQVLGALDNTLTLNTPGGTGPKTMIANLITDVYDGIAGNYPLWKQGTTPSATVCYVEQDDVAGDGRLAIYPPTYEFGDTVYKFIGPTTQNFSDLPARAEPDFVTEIVGTDGNEENNYWVKYDALTGVWQESVQPGLDNTFNPSTMPHLLIQTATGAGGAADTFTFGVGTWFDRVKGDTETAAEPSFVGEKITDVFFHRNRFGVLAGESVVLSESGEYFNFWPTTVTTLVDSDPIDAASTNNRIATLDHAIPFNEALYLFSGQGAVQNVLTGGDTGLSTATAQITEASAFACSSIAKPQPQGASLYFVVDRGTASAVYDYSVKNGIADAWNLTAHVPTYLPQDIFQMSLSYKTDILTCLSSADSSNLYVNSFYFNQEGVKIQNSWSKWTFGSSYDIIGAEWLGDILYLTSSRADGLHLEKLDVSTLTEGDLNYRVHLDSLESVLGVYTVTDNKTRWTLACDVDPDTYGTYRAVLSDEAFTEIGAGFDVEFQSGKILWAYGDFSDAACHLGRVYEHLYEFTKPIITAPDDKGTSIVPVTQGRLQIGRWKVLVQDSGGFAAHVLSDEVNSNEVTISEDDFIYTFPSKIIGAGTVGVMHPRSTSTFQFDVGMEAEYARIQIRGDSHLPFTLVGAEWEGTYTVRASRV